MPKPARKAIATNIGARLIGPPVRHLLSPLKALFLDWFLGGKWPGIGSAVDNVVDADGLGSFGLCGFLRGLLLGFLCGLLCGLRRTAFCRSFFLHGGSPLPAVGKQRSGEHYSSPRGRRQGLRIDSG